MSEHERMGAATGEARAVFGAGCFWGVEHRFRQMKGVIDATSGYSGGQTENPSYREVCGGGTGHAEVVEVVFDPERVSYESLVRAFFGMHNPTTRNRQGPDVGTQYRSAIFATSESQFETATRVRDSLGSEAGAPGTVDGKPIVTEIAMAGPFYRAEEYHQRYFEKNGVGGCAL